MGRRVSLSHMTGCMFVIIKLAIIERTASHAQHNLYMIIMRTDGVVFGDDSGGGLVVVIF